MFKVDWIQHAVGHGGFHTGHVSLHDEHLANPNLAEFTWVFDCGSRASERLNDFVRLWTRLHPRPVDWLFLSHFDFDHVSGLDELMSRSVVRDVMLPYVNEDELAFALLAEIARGNLAPSFTSLIADPARHLLSRGAERVTFLQGRSGPRSEDLTTPPADPSDGYETGCGWKVVMSKVTPLKPLPHVGNGGRRNTVVQVVDGGFCDVQASKDMCSLLLRAYRAPITAAANTALLTELKRKFGTVPWAASRPGLGDLTYAIAHHARTSTGRKDLKSIYDTHAGSSNRSSLSLLSLPSGKNGAPLVTRIGGAAPPWVDRKWSAWMSTGDAELLDSADVSDWMSHFQPYLDHVRMLALPHHGSDHNSDDALQAACPNARLLAMVKAGAKKHPGAGVVQAGAGRLTLVTGEPASSARMWAYL